MRSKSIKLVSTIITLLLVVSMVSPLAMGSSSTGTGSSRVVTLNNPYIFTNATVTVPEVLNNETANYFEFLVVDESSSAISYTFNMTVNGTNDGTVTIVSVADGNATGWLNYTADAIPLNDNVNITIQMLFTTNWTEADNWTGLVDVVDAQTYTLRVTTIDMLIAVMGFAVVILLIGAVVSSVNNTGKTANKGNSK